MQLKIVRKGEGRPVLFTHGLGRDHTTWQKQVDALADAATTIAWDLPGHGASEAPEDPAAYTREACLAHMDDLLGDGRAVLVGHSLGGYLSLCYGITRPDRVAGLVLIATGPGYRDPDGRAKWNQSILRNPSAIGLNEVSAQIGLQHDDLAMRSMPDLSIPTILMVGEEDVRYHGAADYMERKIPGARRVTIPGAGHDVQESHPDAVDEALRGFLSQLGS